MKHFSNRALRYNHHRVVYNPHPMHLKIQVQFLLNQASEKLLLTQADSFSESSVQLKRYDVDYWIQF